MNIAKVQVEIDSEADILKVIPEHYTIEVMSGIGHAIKNVNGEMVGSCKVEGTILLIYAYETSLLLKRAFMSAFEMHNKCQFVETK